MPMLIDRLPEDRSPTRRTRAARRSGPSRARRHLQRRAAPAPRRARVSTRAADEAPLLGEHREDEVGVLLGQEVELVLRAVQVALAAEHARADGDLRLDDVVAGAERVGLRIEEGQQALLLVRLEVAPELAARRRRRRAPRRRRARITRSRSPATSRTLDRDEPDDGRRVPRSGCARIRTAGIAQQQHRRRRGRAGASSPARCRGGSSAPARRPARASSNSDGWSDERPEVDPAARAAARRARSAAPRTGAPRTAA